MNATNSRVRIGLWPLLPALLVLALAACRKPPEQQPDVRPVRVIAAAAASGEASTEYSAEIRPRIESRLGFRVPGKIVTREVDIGAVVKKGQLLATLDARDLQLSRDAAQAQLAAARTDYELATADLRRFTGLRAQGFISAADLERRQSTADGAKARLEQAQAQLQAQGNQAGYANLVSDVGGVVTAVEAEAGQVVAAGQTVVRVAREGDKEASFSIPEDQVEVLRRSRTIEVRTWARPERALTARVREIAPLADPASRTFPVRASLVNPPADVLLGMTASVRLVAPPGPQRIRVPLTAVVRQTEVPTVAPKAEASKGESAKAEPAKAEAPASRNDRSAVWVLDPNTSTVNLVPVVTGATRGTSIVIEQGLQPGQLVVTAGVHKLTPGQKVTRLPEGGIGTQPATPQ